MGEDLGGTGETVQPIFEVGDGPCLCPPNILEKRCIHFITEQGLSLHILADKKTKNAYRLRYLVSLAVDPFVLLSLANSWYLMLLLQLGSVAHFPLLAPPPGMGSPWRSTLCRRIMKLHSASYLRLICFAVAGLGAPLSRFLKGATYKFLNE